MCFRRGPVVLRIFRILQTCHNHAASLKLTCSPLRIDGWKMISFILGPALLSGAKLFYQILNVWSIYLHLANLY